MESRVHLQPFLLLVCFELGCRTRSASVDGLVLEAFSCRIGGSTDASRKLFHALFRGLIVAVADCDEPAFDGLVGNQVARKLGIEPVPEFAVVGLLDLDQEADARSAGRFEVHRSSAEFDFSIDLDVEEPKVVLRHTEEDQLGSRFVLLGAARVPQQGPATLLLDEVTELFEDVIDESAELVLSGDGSHSRRMRTREINRGLVPLNDAESVFREVISAQIGSRGLFARPLPNSVGVPAGPRNDPLLAHHLADLEIDLPSDVLVEMRIEPILSVEDG